MRAIIAGLVLVATPAVASAQSDQAKRCASFNAAYAAAADNVAYMSADGLREDSAVRATQRATEIQNQLSLIEINIELMKAANCELPKSALTTGAYWSDAKACFGRADPMDPENKCDRQNWKADPAAPEPIRHPPTAR